MTANSTDKRSSVKSGNAFTLIELLVVIAIISILGAILFPVFARARENARRSSCLSNLRQMGLAVTMYTQDYDERYPQSWNTGVSAQTPPDGYWWGTDRYWYWPQILYPYHKNVDLYFCPSAPTRVYYANRPAPTSNSYGANTMLLASTASRVQSVAVADVPLPSQIYMLMDASYYRIEARTAVTTQSYQGFIPGSGDAGATYHTATTNKDWQSGRHFGGVNVAFADGHVKWLKSAVVYRQAVLCRQEPDQCNRNWDPAVVGRPTVESAWNPFAQSVP